MPIYVGYSQKRRTVRLLSAGGTQYLLCPPTDIEMTADVSDLTNTRNHTFLWEQIAGPAVILASTDTISTSFPFSDTTDKTFRFYIDPGTNREQYKDIDIFYTPTSVHGQVVTSKSDPFYKSMTTPNIAQIDTFILEEPAGVTNSNLLITPATAVTFDPVSLIELLHSSVKLEILTDPGYVVNPEVIYGTYDYAAGELVYVYDLPNGVYRFRFHYDLGTVKPTVVTSPLVICASTNISDDAWGIDSVADYQIVKTTPHFLGLTRFTIARQIVDEEYPMPGVSAGLLNASGGFYNPAIDPPPVTILTPRLIQAPEFPELDEEFPLTPIVDSVLSGVIRLDPSNIGN